MWEGRPLWSTSSVLPFPISAIRAGQATRPALRRNTCYIRCLRYSGLLALQYYWDTPCGRCRTRSAPSGHNPRASNANDLIWWGQTHACQNGGVGNGGGPEFNQRVSVNTHIDQSQCETSLTKPALKRKSVISEASLVRFRPSKDRSRYYGWNRQ